MSKMFRTIGTLLVCLFLVSCAQKNIQPFDPVDLSQKLGGKYKSKVDNFLVIFDASSSMYMDYNQEMKFKQSKRTLHNMNQTIPAIEVVGGIRAFGPKPYTLKDKDPLLYGMTKYARNDFAAALDSVTSAGGGTPLAAAISVASGDLAEASGKTALIVISDAEDVGQAPVEAAKALKADYRGEICIYTIQIGNSAGAKGIMSDIANASSCGFATDYATLNSPAGMAEFVEKVFLEKIVEAPAPAPKVSVDSDGDGVMDEFDKCPGTPLGIKVDEFGCPLPITKPTSIRLRIEFDYDKYFIRPEYHQMLKEFAAFMNDYPDLVVTIEGHTDSRGTNKYNQELSERRAYSVSQYLATYFNVNTGRLKSIGYGEERPETTNDTDAGRQQNRRVMALIDVSKK